MKAKNVAKMLGISPSTVSMVLNNKPGISERRRAQILGKIRELGYDSLLNKTASISQTIGFVVYKSFGDIVNESPFFSLIMEGISKQVGQYDYSLMCIHITKDIPFDEKVEQINSSNCQGLIVFATEAFQDDLLFLKAAGLPFVLLDNYFVLEDIDTVSINNEQGVYKSVSYLAELGHRRIGYIQSKTIINSFTERIESFYRAMTDLGLDVPEKYIYRLAYSEMDSAADMKKILDNTIEMPSALIADNDLLAFGAMKALRDSGYRVPEDISIIGFDDRPICMYSNPPLSTIAVPKGIFGPVAVDILFDRINNKRKMSIKLEVGVELIERGSVAPHILQQ